MNETQNRASAQPEPFEPQVFVRGNASGFTQAITAGRHELTADEPVSAGGADAGLSPYNLLLAALGACTSMTIGIYARQKKWPVERIGVALRHSRIHAEDCKDCETKMGFLDHIDLRIEIGGSLTDEQRSRLFEIAGKCPVHRTLTSEIDIRSTLA